MKNIRTCSQFDEAAQSLCGFAIAGVTYFEVQDGTDERFYLQHPQIGHFLDFGFEFKLTDGQFRSFLWDRTFYKYGIGIYPHQAKLEINTKRQWVVSDAPEWASLIGSTIESVTVFWSWVSESIADDKMSRTSYPQDMQLSFSGGRNIYISASQYSESSDSLFGMSDTILVIFDESSAAKFCVGPYAKDA